jgi:hypothetical protein
VIFARISPPLSFCNLGSGVTVKHLAVMTGATALAASGFWTAHDPFVGTWKLDVSRSVIVDQMSVKAAGPNKYTFRFEGGPPETIVADGTDQPGVSGTTLSIKAQDSRGLKVVRKQKGRIIVSANWKLAEDGRTLHDAFTGTQPDGSTNTTDYLYKRISGTSGFTGNWESITQPVGLKVELHIQPYGGEGLSFVRQGSVKSITFDGRDHTVAGAAEGATASGLRHSERAMEYTDKSSGKVVDTRALTLSQDGKTLTIDVHTSGQATPNVLVFARE